VIVDSTSVIPPGAEKAVAAAVIVDVATTGDPRRWGPLPPLPPAKVVATGAPMLAAEDTANVASANVAAVASVAFAARAATSKLEKPRI